MRSCAPRAARIGVSSCAHASSVRARYLAQLVRRHLGLAAFLSLPPPPPFYFGRRVTPFYVSVWLTSDVISVGQVGGILPPGLLPPDTPSTWWAGGGAGPAHTSAKPHRALGWWTLRERVDTECWNSNPVSC